MELFCSAFGFRRVRSVVTRLMTFVASGLGLSKVCFTNSLIWFGRGRRLRTTPYSSSSTGTGTTASAFRFIESCSKGKSKPFHCAYNLARSACCSWITPTTASLPSATSCLVAFCHTGKIRRQPAHQEAKWISSTFFPLNCESETCSPVSIRG